MVHRDSILILKAGNTLAPIAARLGDFERWFAEAIGPSLDRFEVANLAVGGVPQWPVSQYAGIILTGSSSSMTVSEPWYGPAMELLCSAAEQEVPILGVCFGHQMLAVAFGGLVEKNPRGREVGTVQVELLAEGLNDPLFDGLGPTVTVNASHQDAVVKMPRGALLLATNERCAVQAFSLGDRIRAVQWHPEINREAVLGYIEGRAEILRSEGLDPKALGARAVDTPSGIRILTNFDRHFVTGR